MVHRSDACYTIVDSVGFPRYAHDFQSVRGTTERSEGGVGVLVSIVLLLYYIYSIVRKIGSTPINII